MKDSELERLAILSEEMGEVQQIIGKILRHGYESFNPYDRSKTNRQLLEKEIGDVKYAIYLLCECSDISEAETIKHMNKKELTIIKWLHHQNLGE